jgi:alpha-D-ribose 1-methylphosphonate 5-triphosphate diphosphatase PhnM
MPKTIQGHNAINYNDQRSYIKQFHYQNIKNIADTINRKMYKARNVSQHKMNLRCRVLTGKAIKINLK